MLSLLLEFFIKLYLTGGYLPKMPFFFYVGGPNIVAGDIATFPYAMFTYFCGMFISIGCILAIAGIKKGR